GVLDLALRLPEDQAEHSAGLPELAEGLAVMLFEPHALDRRVGEVGPAISLRDGLYLAGDRGPLVCHLQEEDVGELFEVILVRQPVVAKDVAVRPQLLDDPVGEIAHEVECVTLKRTCSRTSSRARLRLPKYKRPS